MDVAVGLAPLGIAISIAIVAKKQARPIVVAPLVEARPDHLTHSVVDGAVCDRRAATFRARLLCGCAERQREPQSCSLERIDTKHGSLQLACCPQGAFESGTKPQKERP